MARSPRWFPPLLLLLLLPPPALPAGCAARGLCCPGRDPACLSTGRRPDGSTGPCYCDQACVRTLDCCHDYAETCPVIPCVVSQWSTWSGCAEPCKTTYRVRTRHIVQEPRNGAEACPALEERAGCVEYWTRQGTECKQSLIPALITTGGFGKARKKRAAADGKERAGYCVEFQLVAITPGCLHSHHSYTHWMRYLREGHTVCVECQHPALDSRSHLCSGDGTGSRNTGDFVSPSDPFTVLVVNGSWLRDLGYVLAPEVGWKYWNQLLHWQAVGNPRCKGTWRRIRQLDTCSCPSVHSFLFI